MSDLDLLIISLELEPGERPEDAPKKASAGKLLDESGRFNYKILTDDHAVFCSKRTGEWTVTEIRPIEDDEIVHAPDLSVPEVATAGQATEPSTELQPQEPIDPPKSEEPGQATEPQS